VEGGHEDWSDKRTGKRRGGYPVQRREAQTALVAELGEEKKREASSKDRTAELKRPEKTLLRKRRR